MKSNAKRNRSQGRALSHYEWLEHVAARTDLKPAQKVVLLRLGMHHNIKTGRCDPSYAGLAERSGVSERTAIRAVAIAEVKGLLAIERGNGRGNRNQFRLLLPSERVSRQTGFDRTKGDRKRVTRRARKGDTSDQERVTRLSPEPEENLKNRERDAAHARGGIPNGAVLTDAPVEEYFRELQAFWQRPWNDNEEDNRRAFVRACRRHDPSAIIEAARLRVAAADGPRYLPVLAIWLDDKGWLKPPPTRKQRANGHRNQKNADWMIEAGERLIADKARGQIGWETIQ